jgi:hypothetical protein
MDLTQKAAEEKNPRKNQSISTQQIDEWADEVVREKDKYMSDNRFNLPALQNRFGCSGAIAKRVKESSRSKLERIGFVVLWR